jgi:two-component system nitrogen regulation sensor histidine kinase NtrY
VSIDLPIVTHEEADTDNADKSADKPKMSEASAEEEEITHGV